MKPKILSFLYTIKIEIPIDTFSVGLLINVSLINNGIGFEWGGQYKILKRWFSSDNKQKQEAGMPLFSGRPTVCN